MATTLLGPLLPQLASRWALSDASAGALFTAQFFGQLTATTLSTLITARVGERRTLAIGFLLVAVGVGAVGVVPASLRALVVLTYGLGLGCVLPVTNNLIAALSPARAASALSLVNVSWGVGAMTWPLVVNALSGVHQAGATTLLAVAALAIGATWVAMPATTPTPAKASAGRSSQAAAVPAGVVASHGLLILLYVGSETAIGGWVAAFARRMADGQGAWAYAPTAFWTAQTAGRLLTPLALRRVAEPRLLVSSLLASVAAVLILSGAATSVGGVIGASALAGLGVAPIFPLLWAGVTREVAPSRPATVGPLFAAGGIGGAVLPWLVGVVSTMHGLGTGLLVPLSALLLMLAVMKVAVPGPGTVIRGRRS
jgi:FHS family glucose/mannose:H+ symporter-like MFS transporter